MSSIQANHNNTTTIKQEHMNSLLSEVKLNYNNIVTKIFNYKQVYNNGNVNLIAVSKTKPFELISELYNIGHRRFGENYVHEMVEKAKILPGDIKWHFIGHLQSNKCKKLLEIPNIEVIESVDSMSLVTTLQKLCTSSNRILNIFIQINTSDENSKSGIDKNEIYKMIDYILKNLKLKGLMTIGHLDSTIKSPELCFQELIDLKNEILIKYPDLTLELSMGMSSDLEIAIKMGSSNVRVGSAIFGAREYKTVENGNL